MKKLFIGAALVVSLTVVSHGSVYAKAETASFESIIAEAKAKHAIAKKEGNVWKQKKMKKSFVDTFIDKAQAAKKAGKNTEAVAYANQALNTATQQIRQLRAEIKPTWLE